ncbi:MAG: hypothetical protein IJ131_02840 [Eggerthellaceae bacterium]|nr:hypothetical protein [Eggerthellaceae bacterium]
MTMTATDIKKKYGISAQMLDEIDARAANGELPGEPGPVSVGRPLKFGTSLKMVGYKEVPETVEAIDRRADSLGMTRSDYLRSLVRQDLAHA